MKKILYILIMLLIPCFIFASYNEFLQQGNAAYKSKNWLEAVRNYKKAYQEQPGATLKKFMDASIANAYKEGLAKGLSAYKAGDMAAAYKWYSQAQEVAPSAKMESFLAKIQSQAGPDVMIGEPAAAQGNNDNPLKWVLIGADAALIGLGAYLVMDFNQAADDYNALHDLIDNTTQANYDLLVSEKNEAEGKQTLATLVCVAAGAAVAYTLADLFAIHVFFPVNVSAAFNPAGERFEVAVNKEF